MCIFLKLGLQYQATGRPEAKVDNDELRVTVRVYPSQPIQKRKNKNRKNIKVWYKNIDNIKLFVPNR